MLTAQGMLPANTPLIPKPFTPQTLLRRVQAALSAEPDEKT